MLKTIITSKNNRLSRLFLGIVIPALFVHTAYADDRCAGQIDEEISRFNLTDKTVSKIEIVEIYEGHMDSAAIEYYEGWVSFKECKGNLVIRMGRSCLFDTAYTTTECNIPGLKKY